jgi:2-oxoisovalerate dehydrogenase E1 component alpha subunit
VQRTAARFAIRHTAYLDTDGRPLGRVPRALLAPALLRGCYEQMHLARAFDQRAVRLQRTGQLGTYASALGQEATHVGLARAMRAHDVLVPTYREVGAQLVRGVRMEELLQYWGGDERGSDFAVPRQDFPVAVPIATQCTHAAGIAAAFRIRGEARAVVCCIGDGGTSKGDFYEALNLAGAWQLPLVMVVINNQWAISVPRAAQSAAPTLAQKAIAAGIPGEQVDGNDVLAVYARARRALTRARSGQGPALVEALTYRLSDHTTADDARRYRDEAEVSAAWKRDPIARLRALLGELGAWTPADEEALAARCQAEVERAIEVYRATPPPEPAAMFDSLYAQLPPVYAEQRAQLGAQAHG